MTGQQMRHEIKPKEDIARLNRDTFPGHNIDNAGAGPVAASTTANPRR